MKKSILIFFCTIAIIIQANISSAQTPCEKTADVRWVQQISDDQSSGFDYKLTITNICGVSITVRVSHLGEENGHKINICHEYTIKPGESANKTCHVPFKVEKVTYYSKRADDTKTTFPPCNPSDDPSKPHRSPDGTGRQG